MSSNSIIFVKKLSEVVQLKENLTEALKTTGNDKFIVLVVISLKVFFLYFFEKLEKLLIMQLTNILMNITSMEDVPFMAVKRVVKIILQLLFLPQNSIQTTSGMEDGVLSGNALLPLTAKLNSKEPLELTFTTMKTVMCNLCPLPKNLDLPLVE